MKNTKVLFGVILIVTVQLIIPFYSNSQDHKILLDSVIKAQPPVFNINNAPINICFIKNDSSKYVGFIIAGHAEKAICQIASLEVERKLEKIGYTDSTIFSFGVGYDLRVNNWTEEYDSLLNEMNKTFRALSDSNPLMVKVFSVRLKDYLSLGKKIKDNFYSTKQKLNDTTLGYKQLIINYKENIYPLVQPFYDDNTALVSFKIKKIAFGQIPNFLNQSYTKMEIENSIKLFKKYLSTNKNTLTQITPLLFHRFEYSFPYYKYESGFFKEIKTNLGFPVKEGFIETNSLTGERIQVTYQDAKYKCDNGLYSNIIEAKRLLKEWDDLINEYSNFFPKHKKDIIDEITQENVLLQNEINNLSKFIEIVNNDSSRKQDNSHIIDAFLRGWTFNSFQTNLNNQLYNWYSTKREAVWRELLKSKQQYFKIINPILVNGVNKNIAGIFQSENVFFNVRTFDDYYLVTPYQMIGGDFIQVINKELPIAQFYTLNNFRNLKK